MKKAPFFTLVVLALLAGSLDHKKTAIAIYAFTFSLMRIPRNEK
jgi:hypothetical protein